MSVADDKAESSMIFHEAFTEYLTYFTKPKMPLNIKKHYFM